MTTWQVQAAKQRFSELIRAAQAGDAQFITKHGEPVAVVIDIAEYRRTHAGGPSFAQYLLSAPETEGFELPPRSPEPNDRIDDLVAQWSE